MEPEATDQQSPDEREEALQRYIEWVLKVDNHIWSAHVATIVNKYIEDAQKKYSSKEEYLRSKGEWRER